MTKPSSQDMLKRVIAPLAVWAVTKVLDAPRVKKTLGKVDDELHKQRRKAERSVVRASSNAMKNRVWLAAGVVAIVTGVSLLARATKR
jgi:uncharacterized protein (DUF2236 family)